MSYTPENNTNHKPPPARQISDRFVRVSPYQQLDHNDLEPFAMPVALFGVGPWGQKTWLPILQTLARWGVISLTVIDRWDSLPSELLAVEQEDRIRYLSWNTCFLSEAHKSWRVAFVVTSPSSHREVILTTLDNVRSVRVMVCEKPCGSSLAEAREIVSVCERKGVKLIEADHYLLRPGIQYLLFNRQPLEAIGNITHFCAVMKETKGTGPSQGVISDMLVHLINIIGALWPGSHFLPKSAFMSRVRQNANTTDETYVAASGSLLIPDNGLVPCYMECGKQLSEDVKTIKLLGTRGCLNLDLVSNTLTLKTDNNPPKEVRMTWSTNWSYARLVLAALHMA